MPQPSVPPASFARARAWVRIGGSLGGVLVSGGLATGCSGDAARATGEIAEASAPESESLDPRGRLDDGSAPALDGTPAGEAGTGAASGPESSAIPESVGRAPATSAESGLDVEDQTLDGLSPLESRWVFDGDALRTYELSLAPEDWQTLQDTAQEERYVPADLFVADRVVENVGLRFKGSLGTLVSCFDETGARTCSKLSMKVEFSEYLPDQRFMGLRRLVFNSMIFDDSQLRERLAYRVYREMGLVAPRAAHARLIVNGEDLGLFSLVEAVDGTFTDEHFRGGDGNLYKELWPGSPDPGPLADALKTNEEAADHGAFSQFHAELSGAAEGDLSVVLERYMDVDALFAYLAVARGIVDWDGVGAFYCFEEAGCYNHNYYLYQHEGQARFSLIPWDLDNTFEAVTPVDGIPGFFEDPGDCGELPSDTGRTARAPGCDRVFRALAGANRARYVAQLDRLLDGPFRLGVLEGWLDAWRAQIDPVVADDASGPGLEQFRREADRLSSGLGELRDRLLAHRSDQASR